MLKYIFFTLIVLLGVVALLYFASPVAPVVWKPDAMQELTGKFARNERLADATSIVINGHGPEDLVFDDNGDLLTGLEDGRIVRLRAPDFSSQSTVVDTGGRPLGLRFDGNRDLIIADAGKGLLRYDFDQDRLDVLADAYNGVKLVFVDHLDIAENGDIYFSDASTRFGIDEFVLDFVEASFTGRIFKFSPETNELTLVLDDLFFANGVALGPGDEYLLVNETGTARIWKLFLRGENSGETGIFASSLPGAPDNIYFDEQGVFWVGIVALRDPNVESLSDNTFLRRLIGNIPTPILEKSAPYGMVLAFDEQGHVVANLQTPTKFFNITAAVPHNDRLYLGFLGGNRIAYLEAALPGLD